MTSVHLLDRERISNASRNDPDRITSAVVIYPTEDPSVPGIYDNEIRLLGLTLSERLWRLIRLAGFQRVALVTANQTAGPPQNPALHGHDNDRSVASPPFSPDDCPAIVPIDDLLGCKDEQFYILSADLVFDRSALDDPGGIPRVRGNELLSVIDDPDNWLRNNLPSPSATDPGPSQQHNWVRVRDRQTFRRAESLLLNSLRKPIDGVVSRHINRPLSLAISRYLVRLSWSPNFFTSIFMAIGITAAFVASRASQPWHWVVAGLLFQGQSILDGCDGEVARLTYRFSKTGQWLDTIGDDLTNYLFCFGLAIGLAKNGGPPWIYPLAWATLTAQIMATFVLYRRMIKLGTGDLLAVPVLMVPQQGNAASDRIMRALRALSKRDVFVLIIAMLTALQQPLLAFSLFSLGTFPTVVFVILNDLRLSKQLSQLSVTDHTEAA